MHGKYRPAVSRVRLTRSAHSLRGQRDQLLRDVSNGRQAARRPRALAAARSRTGRGVSTKWKSGFRSDPNPTRRVSAPRRRLRESRSCARSARRDSRWRCESSSRRRPSTSAVGRLADDRLERDHHPFLEAAGRERAEEIRHGRLLVERAADAVSASGRERPSIPSGSLRLRPPVPTRRCARRAAATCTALVERGLARTGPALSRAR